MLRFGSPPSTKKLTTLRERWHLWALVFALGVVIVAMQKLNQPATIEKLDRLLQRPAPAASPSVAIAPASPVVDVDVSGIEDNTHFRPEERETWFELFARLREMDAAQLAAASLGELTYAQLLQQPDEYRGQLVTLRGTVLREEVQQPEENSLGISRYHRLWLRPRGGGQWPFVVYALSLPVEFPRGDQLRADVSVTGYFFNWSYKHDDGLGLAPVVLAKNVDWQRPTKTAPRPAVAMRDLVWVVMGAAVFASLSMWLIVRRTVRRPRRNTLLPETLSLPADWEHS